MSKLVRIDVVCHLTSLSRSTIYRLKAAGQFPEPEVISPRCVRWHERDIEDWIENPKAKSSRVPADGTGGAK